MNETAPRYDDRLFPALNSSRSLRTRVRFSEEVGLQPRMELPSDDGRQVMVWRQLICQVAAFCVDGKVRNSKMVRELQYLAKSKEKVWEFQWSWETFY